MSCPLVVSAGADGTQPGRRVVDPGKGHTARSLELHDPVRAEELLEVVQLVGMAVQGQGEALVPDAEDAALEHADQLDDLRAGRRAGVDRDEQQFALDRLPRVELADLHDVDQLEELLGDLLERRRLDVDDDRDAAEPLVLGRCHRQAEDVVPAPCEQPRDAREHTGLVDDGHAEDVVGHPGHCTNPSPSFGSVMISSFDAPAGTIGNTFSCESVRNSMTTGRSSISFAFWMADSTSSGDSTRMPTQPIASAQSL